MTPTSGWGDDQTAEPEEDTTEGAAVKDTDKVTAPEDEPGVGGYLAYMAGEDEDVADHDDGSDHGVEVPLDMSTGARSTRAANPKKSKQDPAIYHASGDDEEDGVLFSMPACWNRLGVVLRDKGTMRFVKYVSRMAKGDRWDVVGEFNILDVLGDESDEEEGDGKVDDEEVGSEARGGADEDDEDGDNDNDDSSTEYSD